MGDAVGPKLAVCAPADISNLPFLAVDFFCGAGGTTRGLLDAGGFVIAGIDKDRRCRDTYQRNNKNPAPDNSTPEFLSRDIFPQSADYPDGEQEILRKELADLISKCRLRAPRAPLLFAICAPCQPFTKLSKKELSKDRQDRRARDSNLLLEASKFVKEFEPDLILSENVRGISDDRYGGVWEEFASTLEEMGYITGSEVVCTSKFGIPQYRRRSILLAMKREQVVSSYVRDGGCRLIVPTENAESPMVSVKEALAHLPRVRAGERHPTVPNHRTRTLSETNIKRISAAKPGESNAYLASTPDGDLSLPCHRKVNAKLKVPCFTDVYTRMHPDRPSPTITTKCHSISNGRFGHYDTTQHRGISLREAAILQSFPDDYVFHPDKVDPVARMIGNAVPPKLASYFSNYLLRGIDTALVASRRRISASVSEPS